MEIVSILLMLLVLFVLARIGNRIFEHFGVPGLIGEILVGILIANIAIGGDTLLDFLDIEIPAPGSDHAGTNYSVLYAAAEIGVIFLLFSVGLETKVKELLGVGKSAMLVAILGVVIPFVLGFAYIEFTDSNFHHAMFLAAAMVATSVGITARVIKDMHLMDKLESKIIIGAAVIDDVLGMIVLAIVKGVAGSDGGISIMGVVQVIVVACVFVLAAILFAKTVVPKIYAWNERRVKKARDEGKTHSSVNMLALALIVCLFMSWLAESIGLAAIIGAFLAGMMFAEHAWEWKLEQKFETITSVFISFFFIHVGMQVDLGDLGSTAVIISAVAVIVLAVLGKYIGCAIGAKMGDKSISKDSCNIIGIGMVPRGEVGIIVASIGLNTIVEGAPALSSSLYAIIVVMAVATTIIAPPILSKLYRKKYPPEYTITANDKI